MSVKGNLELTSDESSVLSGNITLDQNFFEPIGRYLVKLEPAPNITKIGNQLNVSTAAKATVTMPNGQIIDPLTFSWVDFNPWGAMLTGFAMAWTPWETMTIDLILAIASFMLVPLGLVDISVSIIAFIFTVGGFYQSSLGYTIMYFEIIWLNSIPVYGEAGYYPDQILTPGGSQYNGWIFIPLSPYNFGPHTGIWPNGFGLVII
ncbi:MAG: hypothetical protein N3E52_01955 [Candidatus Bathyarchaeota archaeon]|nr:hypothetical protein [Candidatus Bathyarchaeota archaeon]